MERGSHTAFLVTSMAHVGGTEVATSILARALSGAGWRVAILGEEGPFSDTLAREGIETIPTDFYSRNPIALLRGLFSMAAALRRHRPEVVHCQMARPVPICWAAIRLAGMSKHTKLFWSSRGLEAGTYRIVVPLFKWMGVRALGNCRTEEAKLLRLGMPAARTSYFYNAYRLQKTDRRPGRPAEPPLVIGALAALRPDRRYDHFLEMAAQVKARLGPARKVEFHIAGEGPLRSELMAHAARLGLHDDVRFLGNVFDVASYLRTLHVLVTTFYSDDPDWGAGLSNTIIEAMVVGAPVVAYDSIGVHEIVHDGETGRLVPPGNVAALTEAVLDTALDTAKADALAAAAHENIVKACDPSAVLDRVLRLYREM